METYISIENLRLRRTVLIAQLSGPRRERNISFNSCQKNSEVSTSEIQENLHEMRTMNSERIHNELVQPLYFVYGNRTGTIYPGGTSVKADTSSIILIAGVRRHIFMAILEILK